MWDTFRPDEEFSLSGADREAGSGAGLRRRDGDLLRRMEGARQETVDGPDHQDRGSEDVDLDQGGGEGREVLRVAHGGLGDHDDEEHPSRPTDPFGDIRHVEPDDEAYRRPDEEHGQDGVELRQVPEGHRDALRPLLALRVAGQWSGPGGRRSRRNDDPEEGED